MRIKDRDVDGVLVLDLEGQMHLRDYETFKTVVGAALGRGRITMLLNMAGVSYLSAAGLGEIVRTHATLERRGGALRICCLQK